MKNAPALMITCEHASNALPDFVLRAFRDSDGIPDDVNMIQQRAGSKTISETVDMNVIKTEKRYEMWLEGNRWPDMCRWGEFETAKKAGKEVTKVFDKLFRAKESGDQICEEHDRFYSVYAPEATKRNDTGFKDKYRWFPIPQSVRSLNPGLAQPEGW